MARPIELVAYLALVCILVSAGSSASCSSERSIRQRYSRERDFDFANINGNQLLQCLVGCFTTSERQNALTDVAYNAYGCMKELVVRILNGDIKFPKVCCSLPLFNFICNPTRSRPRIGSEQPGRDFSYDDY